MKIFRAVMVLGICLIGIPCASFAALEWRIEWDDALPQMATVWIFNPERTAQSFALETGDVAQTSDSDPYAPYLIVGQDVSFFQIQPSERKRIQIVVYRDIDPEQIVSGSTAIQASNFDSDQHRQQVRLLSERYGASTSRDYPVVMSVVPVPRVDATPSGDSAGRSIYKSQRGYWITSLIDHDHIAEQLIRTGDRINATHDGIQEAIFYYTQGTTALSGEAAIVWAAAFPELTTEVSPTPFPYGDCMYFVTVVTSNLSYYATGRMISIGDVLAPATAGLPYVVAAQDVNYSLSPNTNSKQVVRVYLMSKRTTPPTQQSEYVRIVNHSTQIEQAIRIGNAENYHPCAIEDVVLYLNHEISSLTTGYQLWLRIGTGGITPTPTPSSSSPPYRSVCVGNPYTQPTGRTSSTTFKNLGLLVGTVLPFSLVVRRKRQK